LIDTALPITSPSPVADPLAGLLVALDLRGVKLLLDKHGQPRAKLAPGGVLDAETRTLLDENRAALVEHLMEEQLWKLGRAAQAGDAAALAAFREMLTRYEEAYS
jgi:hypothetical protein